MPSRTNVLCAASTPSLGPYLVIRGLDSWALLTSVIALEYPSPNAKARKSAKSLFYGWWLNRRSTHRQPLPPEAEFLPLLLLQMDGSWCCVNRCVGIAPKSQGPVARPSTLKLYGKHQTKGGFPTRRLGKDRASVHFCNGFHDGQAQPVIAFAVVTG